MQDFIENFRMRPRAYIGDGWRVVADNPEGDCNDFTLTLAYLMAGRNVVRMFARFLFCRSALWLVWSEKNGLFPRHVALWDADHGWIDSDNRVWRDHHAQKRLALPLTFLPFLPYAVIRMAQGWVYKGVRND